MDLVKYPDDITLFLFCSIVTTKAIDDCAPANTLPLDFELRLSVTRITLTTPTVHISDLKFILVNILTNFCF